MSSCFLDLLFLPPPLWDVLNIVIFPCLSSLRPYFLPPPPPPLLSSFLSSLSPFSFFPSSLPLPPDDVSLKNMNTFLSLYCKCHFVIVKQMLFQVTKVRCIAINNFIYILILKRFYPVTYRYGFIKLLL